MYPSQYIYSLRLAIVVYYLIWVNFYNKQRERKRVAVTNCFSLGKIKKLNFFFLRVIYRNITVPPFKPNAQQPRSLICS